MMVRLPAPMRSRLHYGFCCEKDAQGQTIGAAVMRLTRRNAYERVGLRRPSARSTPPWKST